jgi:hypothetical protein
MITDRDREIVRTLLDKVRLLSEWQVATTWWAGAGAPTARRLRSLAEGGWLVGAWMLARPLLPLDVPLVTWEPRGPAPEFGNLSWRAQSRWTSSASPTPVWRASTLAAARLGGTARSDVKNLCQVTHDLHVAQVYLGLLRDSDPRAAMWVGEDAVPPGLIRGFLPDALLLRRGRIERAIEFGGAYPPGRFARFHEHCEFLGIPYTVY